MKHILFLSFLFFLNSACYSQDVYDVETVPTLRTKCYESCYKQIVIFSAPRTGSSLTYNIFKFLFERDSQLLGYHNDFNSDHRVLKTHLFKEFDLLEKEETLCVFPYRNPTDTAISHFRVMRSKITNNQVFARNVVATQSHFFLFLEKKEEEGFNILRLKYEDSAHNIDFIFDLIEAHFHITIDPADKNLMKISYSKENINACIKDLKGFKEALPISGFHGEHIVTDKFKPPTEFLYWLNFYLKQSIPLFRKYGYFPDDPI